MATRQVNSFFLTGQMENLSLYNSCILQGLNETVLTPKVNLDTLCEYGVVMVTITNDYTAT